MPEQGKCRTCEAEIIWCRTVSGCLMPIDAQPVEGGNDALVDGVAHVIKGDLFETMLPSGPRYQSHFVSCVDADAHRKKGKK